jgi:hypothetical protein
MNESEQITGKVASIINERELTINIGESNGVKVGMIFKVLADKPLEVFDPESNELLGVIDREKVRVKVSEVYEKFSVCRTYVTHVIGGRGIWGSSSMAAIAAAYSSEPREVVETLKAKDKTLPPPLPEEESYVKRGDSVVSVKDKD